MTTRVFISYAKEDKAFAEKLNRDLQQAGVKTWFDIADLLPGQYWERAIIKAISDSRYFIALLSSRSVGKKGYVQKEIRHAINIAKEYPPDEIYIIPLRIDECSPSFEDLHKLQIADLFPNYKKSFMELLRVFEYESIEKPALVKVDTGIKSGIIKSINPAGYGFVVIDEIDYFFHSNELVNVQFNELCAGDVISFEIEKGPKGLTATNIRRL